MSPVSLLQRKANIGAYPSGSGEAAAISTGVTRASHVILGPQTAIWLCRPREPYPSCMDKQRAQPPTSALSLQEGKVKVTVIAWVWQVWAGCVYMISGHFKFIVNEFAKVD